MAGKFDEPKYQPKKNLSPYLPDFTVDSDFDYTSPYPCGVCHRSFTSRTELATHPHQKGARR
jgi:hypothetical protein